MKFYITFGQVHVHRATGKTFDKDGVAVIEAKDEGAARDLAFRVFGRQWHRCLSEPPRMSYFPRGLVEV